MAEQPASKIKIKNIYYMLSYAYQTLRENGVDSVSVEDFDNIHDLFAAILVQGAGIQVKRGLHRDYVEREEALAGLRGQIRIGETIKQLAHVRGKLVCAFDEFSVDSPHNRALKSVMNLLLRHGDVTPTNKDSLRKLLLYFGEVSSVPPTSIRWDALKYNRSNASYAMLIGICRLVVEGLLLTNEKGEHKLSAWLQDEKMHSLYEKFVLAYYRRHYPEFSPRAKHVDWDIAFGDDRSHLPTMKTDVMMQYGGRTLIIDAKYYQKTTQSSHDKKTFISNNLYQIYAYVKNSDAKASGSVAGLLLYAKTDADVAPDADYVIGGNRIGLKSLDLNMEWCEIAAQLDRLCSWLKTGEARQGHEQEQLANRTIGR